jgi:AcrR family transcriptional regulator
MVTSVPYDSTGRTRQKSRTREALVTATRELLARGQTPKVEEAAELAGISRTTAYRYFPNQRSLLIATQPQISPDTLLPTDAPTELTARLDAFMTAFSAYNLEWEPQLRASLRLPLEANGPQPVLRRAVGWIEDALAPLQQTHPHVDIRRLAVSLRSATGIESLIWLIDIAGYGREEAAETVRRTAHAIVAAAIA